MINISINSSVNLQHLCIFLRPCVSSTDLSISSYGTHLILLWVLVRHVECCHVTCSIHVGWRSELPRWIGKSLNQVILTYGSVYFLKCDNVLLSEDNTKNFVLLEEIIYIFLFLIASCVLSLFFITFLFAKKFTPGHRWTGLRSIVCVVSVLDWGTIVGKHWTCWWICHLATLVYGKGTTILVSALHSIREAIKIGALRSINIHKLIYISSCTHSSFL